MQAVRIVDGAIQVVDVPRPQSDGVRVRIRSAGICGSDLHLIDAFPVPHTLGHEVAGELEDGRVVAIEPLAPCGHCDPCSGSEYNLCRDGFTMIYGIGRDGGMADELVVEERSIVPLPRGVSVNDACLVEPLAVAVHGCRRAGVREGMRVAVVGAGTIGLCAVAAARASGAVVGIEARHAVQQTAADRLGAGPAEGEYDLVVDCAGTKGALERAVELCRPGGSLLLLASYWDGMDLPGMALCMKEITVLPSSLYADHSGGRDVDAAATLLATRPEIPQSLITHRFPLEAAPEAFEKAASRQEAIKVVLEPN